MKLYKISGSSEYVDWDVLHNQQGYSTSATNPVTWKSSLGNSWGETVANGYMEPTAASGWATKGFCLGKRGWHNMDDMANIYYVWPDVATSAKARHDTWGESDVAVWDYDGTHTLYLVQKELEEGWMDEDTFAERGWEIVPDVPLGELIFVDASTGAVVYSVESLNEMAFAPTGYFTIEDDSGVLFVEESPYPARGTLAKNYTPNVTIADGSGVDTGLPYYSQKLYIPVVVWHDENWNLGTDYFGWNLSDSSGNVYATNNTGSSRIVISIIVAMIDATDAEIVEVKNQSDAHFYAFKWTSGGVPYWYVVDGDEDWTDDLEADGYEEVPSVVLPTVSITGDWGSNNWLYANTGGTNVSVLAGNSVLIGMSGSSSPISVDYDTTKSYSVIRWATYQSTQGSGHTEYSIINSNDKIYAQNVTSGDLYLYAMRVAVCSSNQATVVTVYNSSNVAYNAFKYITNDTDYYYVLDETQTDWTDDLASIGYHDEDYIDIFAFGQTGTVSRQGSVTSSFSGTVDSSCVIKLYDGPNLVTPMPFDSTVRYDVGYYDSGNWIPDAVQSLADMPATTSSPYVTAGLAIDSSGQLSIWEVRNQTGTGSVNISWNNWQIRAYSEAYTTRNLPRRTAYFTNSGSAGTTNTKVTPSQGGNGYLLYDASGNPIPYDSSKTYQFLRGFDVSGGGVAFAGRLYFEGGGGYLRLHSYGWNWSTYVFRIEYSVT